MQITAGGDAACDRTLRFFCFGSLSGLRVCGPLSNLIRLDGILCVIDFAVCAEAEEE
jgi:hypothetical protein